MKYKKLDALYDAYKKFINDGDNEFFMNHKNKQYMKNIANLSENECKNVLTRFKMIKKACRANDTCAITAYAKFLITNYLVSFGTNHEDYITHENEHSYEVLQYDKIMRLLRHAIVLKNPIAYCELANFYCNLRKVHEPDSYYSSYNYNQFADGLMYKELYLNFESIKMKYFTCLNSEEFKEACYEIIKNEFLSFHFDYKPFSEIIASYSFSNETLHNRFWKCYLTLILPICTKIQKEHPLLLPCHKMPVKVLNYFFESISFQILLEWTLFEDSIKLNKDKYVNTYDEDYCHCDEEHINIPKCVYVGCIKGLLNIPDD